MKRGEYEEMTCWRDFEDMLCISNIKWKEGWNSRCMVSKNNVDQL